MFVVLASLVAVGACAQNPAPRAPREAERRLGAYEGRTDVTQHGAHGSRCTGTLPANSRDGDIGRRRQDADVVQSSQGGRVDCARREAPKP